ncbi:MAG: xanthine phosphoribosyltransferase [Synergistaceae bacterium]|jgi:xanthine phosphoribosyltransferase|nr:xanthine phosphoribosyltransferase [Synergistaceae bacterium]
MTNTAERYHKTFSISWEQLQNDCRALAWKILSFRRNWCKIIAIARGGLIPAAIVARELNISVVDTVCISSYTLRNRNDGLDILKRPDLADMNDSWLIIDDLVDTGRTAKTVRQMFPGIHFAAVYAKPEGRPIVNTFITEVSQDTWILFPWDSFPTTSFIAPIADTLEEAAGQP